MIASYMYDILYMNCWQCFAHCSQKITNDSVSPLFQALESKHIGAGGMPNYVLLSNLKMIDSDDT